MHSLESLSHIEDIKALKARYWRTMDTKDWDGFRGVFAPDAEMLFPEIGGAMSTEEMMAWITPFLSGAITLHHGMAPEIEILSDTTAKGIWQIEDELIWPSDAPAPGGLLRVHGHGHYHETYERTAQGWKIKTLRLSRLHLTREYAEGAQSG